MQKDISSDQYVPGNCNIGVVEVKRRYRIGYAGALLMILFIVLAETFRLTHHWKLLLFIPASISLSGFLQAWLKFCFLYGYKGVFSIVGRKTFTKVQQNDLRKDRWMALKIVIGVFLGSSLITALYYFFT